MESILDTYLKVAKNVNIFEPANLQPYTPIPTSSEIEEGEIIRYFACFATHIKSAIDITEVQAQVYSKVKNNPLYKTVKVKWKIRGKLEDEYNTLTPTNERVRLYTGVITSNKEMIKIAEKTMPGLGELIKDYKKFWVGQ